MANNYGGYLGAFIPTTNIWDTSELQNIDVTKPEFTELLVRLYQNLNRMSQMINIKDSGFYYPQEFVNGQKFFPNPNAPLGSTMAQTPRQDFRMTVYWATALPSATSVSIPHNIPWTPTTTATRIYGASTNLTTMKSIPLPYASASGDNVELQVNATNVVITTDSASWIGYTVTYIVIEYLKF
jgi:hypothetical protein